MADVRALGALSADVLATVSEIILAHDVTGWIANSKGTDVKFIYSGRFPAHRPGRAGFDVPAPPDVPVSWPDDLASPEELAVSVTGGRYQTRTLPITTSAASAAQATPK